MFVPAVLLLPKNTKERIISYVIVATGFVVLIKSNYMEGLLFYSLSTLISSFFLIKRNKKSVCILSGILGIFSILVLFEAKKIIYMINSKTDLYLDKVLLTLYTKEISLLPKNEMLYSTKTVYNLWSDFVPIYILEKFGWLLGSLILLIPIFIFLYGLWLSIKNFHSAYGKVVLALTITLLIYTVMSLLPLIPHFPKYGLYYPLYGYITGFMIVWIYLFFVGFLLKEEKQT